MRLTLFLIFTLALLAPDSVRADFIVPTNSGDPFDTLQNLSVNFETSAASTPLLDHGTIPLPINEPISLSYHIDHKSFWPNHSVSSLENDSLFSDFIKSNKLYVDLWEGVPFTSDAHMIQFWDITGTSTGQIMATFPKQDSYFIVAYFPDGFYQDPQSTCPDDPDWQTNCAPSYTLDQMRGYFNSSVNSPDAFPYLPDAFGGTEFITEALATTPRASNVLFLPGIEGSRLYMRNGLGIEVPLWEPAVLSGISNLTLNSNGTSRHEIYTRDLVDYKYGIKALGDVYGPFEDFMDGLVSSGTISKWTAYPYDWRFDVRDIVSNGTLIGASTGPLTRISLTDVVRELASSSPTGRVTIVAHSNGGLLAKALAMELQKENQTNLLDRIIFIGSPQLGTPMTIGALLNGDGQTDVTGGLIMYGGNVREAAATMPSMYGLLPSAEYFLHAGAPVLFGVDGLNNLYEKSFGSQINSESSFSDFLTDTPDIHRNFSLNDLRTPLALSDTVLKKEIETHEVLDAWAPPLGLVVTSISGWGNPTPYQYTYSTSDKKVLSCFRSSLFLNNCAYAYQVRHTLKNTESGDDTVVSVSALSDATSSHSFYFNARTFSADRLGAIGHGDLTSAAPIESLIKNLLENKDKPVPYISSSSPSDGISSSVVISVHSPVNIIATDDDGNQTGIFQVPGKTGIYYEKENIPGSSLQILDDEKYLYLPNATPFAISIQGYDSGLTTLDLGTVDSSGESATTEEFSDIPTTASTSAEFSLGATSTFPKTIAVDIFGDGSTTPFESGEDGLQQLQPADLYSILKKEFTALEVRRGVKNRFLSELTKIETSATSADTSAEIEYLEKLITAQIDINFTNPQGTFFLELLDELKTRAD